ncbi:GspE/PulE family protein [Patescibacteria group bacterium]
MSLVQQLVKKGILEKEKASVLEFEIKSSGKREEEVILEKEIVSEDFLFGLKSESLKIPLKKVDIKEVPLKVLELISEESARFYKMIPLTQKKEVLEVGMVYPEDLKSQEALKFLARQGKFSYKVFLITPTDYEKLFKEYRSLKRDVRRALEELEIELKAEKIERRGVPRLPDEFERLVEEAPISKVVAVILRHAVEGEASDIHIEPTRDKLRIRFRLLGILHSSIFLPMRIHSSVVARIKIISNLKIDEARIPQDGRFSTKINDKTIDFRVSTFPTTLGEKVAIRVLDPIIGFKNFKELGLGKRNFEVTQKAVKKPNGLILATGPTGCGKTTTLYAILRFLNKEEVNICTLEDPVEYFIEGVNQSQVRPEIGYDFPIGLRHIVRQDPDIIMVGEIRDKETASLAIHAALTGHIVLATLHTNDALGVIPRLLDLGIERYLISPTLSIAIAQRLVRRLCPNCKKKVKPNPKIKELIMRELESLPKSFFDSKGEMSEENLKKKTSPIYIYQAKGCKKCAGAGFVDRIGVFEILTMTDQLSDIVLKEPNEKRIKEEAKRQGMITIKQDGILKVLEGTTTIEEVLRVVEEE